MSYRSGPPRDASYSAVSTRVGNAGKLSAGQLQAGKIDVLDMYVQGVPLEDYIHQLVDSTLSSLSTASERRVVPPPPPPPAQPPPPREEQRQQQQENVEFAQVAARAAHATVADVSHAYHDPVNARRGYVLTADETGQGGWQPLPCSGDVEGPLKSRVDSVAVFDTDDGRLLRDCAVTVSHDTLRAPIVETERLVVPTGSTGQVAIKAEQGHLEWRAVTTLPDVQSVLQQITALRAEATELRQRYQQLEQKAKLLEEQNHKLVAPPVFDVSKASVPANTPRASVLVTTEKAGQMAWEPVDAFVRARFDSDDLQHCLPTVVNGTLVGSDITVHDRVHLECNSIKTAEVVSREVHSEASVVRDLTAKNVIVEECSVQKVSVIDLVLPVEAKAGMVLTAVDDSGKCAWKPPGPLAPVPEEESGEEEKAAEPAPSTPVAGQEDLSATNVITVTPLRTHDGILLDWNASLGQVVLADGAHRIAAGHRALAEASPSSVKLIAVGDNALSNCQADETTAVGADSQTHLRSGVGNTSLGARSLESNRDGHHNTAAGHGALQQCLSNANTAVGSGALGGVTTGGHNTGVGAGAGDQIVQGKGNTAVGDGAGPAADYNYTICLGQDARALTHGDVALGSQSAPLRVVESATSGSLATINPTAYLSVTINGSPYKLALFAP